MISIERSRRGPGKNKQARHKGPARKKSNLVVRSRWALVRPGRLLDVPIHPHFFPCLLGAHLVRRLVVESRSDPPALADRARSPHCEIARLLAPSLGLAPSVSIPRLTVLPEAVEACMRSVISAMLPLLMYAHSRVAARAIFLRLCE